MNRKLSLLVALFSSLSLFATNDFNFDFESEETTPSKLEISGWLYDDSVGIIENPLKDEVNSSDNVFVFEAQDGIEWWGGVILKLQQTETTQSKRYLYMKVLAEDTFSPNFRIRLFDFDNESGEFKNEGVDYGSTRSMSLAPEWREFCFEIEAGKSFGAIRLEPRHWGVYYIDDIRLSDQAPVIPSLEPICWDFENEGSADDWSSFRTDDSDAVYRGDLTEEPYNNAMEKNESEFCLRSWAKQGSWDKYGGAINRNVYGLTTEQTRYLHVRFYFRSNEDDAPTNQEKELRLFVKPGDDFFSSEMVSKNSWHDVTIDLGVGTLIQYLHFAVDTWWVTAGYDDIQFDWSPIRQDLTTNLPSTKETNIGYRVENGKLYIDGVEGTEVNIHNISGMKIATMLIEGDSSISLSSGVYILRSSDGCSAKVLIP
ncbi:MAG: T9SS type A sorting domain-containing protein [Bacteroidales bacterium]